MIDFYIFIKIDRTSIRNLVNLILSSKTSKAFPIKLGTRRKTDVTTNIEQLIDYPKNLRRTEQ